MQAVSSGALKRAVARKKKSLRFGGVPQNPAYLKFVRCFSCILKDLQSKNGKEVHSCSGILEAAHTGRHGRGQKAADETALPLCSNGHRTGKSAHHRLGKKFWEYWGLSQELLISGFNEMARESEVLVQEFKS